MHLASHGLYTRREKMHAVTTVFDDALDLLQCKQGVIMPQRTDMT